jgi:hypothetical protein
MSDGWSGVHPFDPTLHGKDSVAGRGHCSWHGETDCDRPPLISFRDATGARQSGCQRVLDEGIGVGGQERRRLHV